MHVVTQYTPAHYMPDTAAQLQPIPYACGASAPCFQYLWAP